MNKIVHLNTNIYGATTLKDLKAPEQNNMALHVCINPEDVLKKRQQLEMETLPLNQWILP